MSEAVKQMIEEGMQATKAYREAAEAFEKKADGLHKATMEKTEKAILDAMEAKQLVEQKAVALEQRLSGIEAALNRTVANQNDKTEEEKHKYVDAVREWLKSGIQAKDFHNLREFEKDFISQKALSVGTDSAGGYLVTPTIGDLMVTRMFETSPIRSVANIVTISQSDAIEFPIDNSEATSGGWVGEQTTRSETNTPTLGMKRIEAREQYAYPFITQKLLDDAAFNVEAWLANKTADILGRTENTSFVTGTGYNRPTGFMTYNAWSVAGTYESGAIEQVVSGAAGEFTADGLIELQNSLLEPYQGNARFVLRRTSFGKILKLKTGDGEYLFNRALDRGAGVAFDVLGKPVLFCADVAAAASNALACAYGDFRQAYTILDRTGIRVLRNPFDALGKVGFYTTKRVGGDIVNFEAIKIHKLAAA